QVQVAPQDPRLPASWNKVCQSAETNLEWPSGLRLLLQIPATHKAHYITLSADQRATLLRYYRGPFDPRRPASAPTSCCCWTTAAPGTTSPAPGTAPPAPSPAGATASPGAACRPWASSSPARPASGRAGPPWSSPGCCT